MIELSAVSLELFNTVIQYMPDHGYYDYLGDNLVVITHVSNEYFSKLWQGDAGWIVRHGCSVDALSDGRDGLQIWCE